MNPNCAKWHSLQDYEKQCNKWTTDKSSLWEFSHLKEAGGAAEEERVQEPIGFYGEQ